MDNLKPTRLTVTDLKFDLLRYSAKKLYHFISICNFIIAVLR